MAASRSVDDSATQKSLSKNTLQMKFMQRGIDQKEEDNSSKQIHVDESHWFIGGVDQQSKKLPYRFDANAVFCQDLLPIGRMSFMNFNPNVEKTHKELLRKAKMKQSTEREDYDQISDEEMAHRYESLVSTIEKKFSKRKGARVDDSISSGEESDKEKQLRKRAKRGFIKPKTD